MRNYKPAVQLTKVEKNPYAVINIENLTEEAAILAVTLDYDVFGHLPEKMKENDNVRLAICDTFGLAILQFSKTATDEQWHRAALQNPTVIRFIQKPREDTVWAVLMADPTLIDLVANATTEMKTAAILLQ
jgi:hypothetical protein